MIKEKNKHFHFHPQELLLLSSAFGAKELFGIADSNLFQLQGVSFEKAFERLQKKELYNKENKITNQAAAIIEMLRQYSQSKKYVKIRNLTFAFFEKDAKELMFLEEVKRHKEYRMHVVDKTVAFSALYEFLPVFNREPLEDETDFLQKELSKRQVDEMISRCSENKTAIFEFYHFNDSESRSKQKASLETLVAFEDGNDLINLDVQAKKFTRTSQYIFWKKIFDEMDFPYGGEANG